MSDRPTRRPPRPSTRTFMRSGADSRKIEEAQERILDALRDGVKGLVDRYFVDARDGVKGLVDRFFDEAREAVRGALLHAGLELYNEGQARGRAQAAQVFHAIAAVAHRRYAAMVRDPRTEIEPPRPTLAEVHAEMAGGGLELSPAELAKLCAELRVELAPETGLE
jgi:hypothetical protein